MLKYQIDSKLLKSLQKIQKKDIKSYNNILTKIEEIIHSNEETILNYKNLKYPLQHLKRVHINTKFILLFRFDSNNKLVIFESYKHHDEAYK
ncbi:MAG: type II toxin-antitoxin system RelE family toxin [Candidatus Woesearchaeota archaeon]